jgi:ABC-type amino acid transport substrate-binding protein
VKPVRLTIVLILLVSLSLAACANLGLELKQDGNANPAAPLPRIRVGVDAVLPPFETTGADANQVIGYDIDLMKSIAARTGFEVEFVKVEYTNLIKLVSVCRLDGAISAIPIKDDLKQQMIFSQPYYTTGHVVVVKKGNISIMGRESLSGMTVGSQEGTLSELEVKKLPGVTPRVYATYFAAFEDLVNGYIDAVIADKPRAERYVGIKRNNLKVVGEAFGVIQYGIAVCSDRPDLAGKIDAALSAMKAESALEKLTKKWMTDTP